MCLGAVGQSPDQLRPPPMEWGKILSVTLSRERPWVLATHVGKLAFRFG